MNTEELRIIPLFKNMSEDILRIVATLVGEERFEAEKVVFEEGSSADRLFIIKDGEVEIRKLIDKDEGRYKLIAVLVNGEFFGEMALFLDRPRSAEAFAKTDVTLITVSKKDLTSLFERSPDAAFKVMEFFMSVIMDRLRSTTNELVTVYETGRLVIASHSISELAGHVMESISNAMSPEAGLFIVWNKFNREYEICNLIGFDLDPGASLPDNDRLIGWLIENREPFLSFDLKNEKRILVSEYSIYYGCSMVAAPFFSHDRLLGLILLIDRTRNNAFSFENMILLSAVGGYVSVALENLEYMQEEMDRIRLSQAKSTIPH
ncbi:MAG: cyclic nucleotide-binding domain-containing protein [Nitrospirae bacterium]|nr:cyclic nucleotide-binding domain-containing protein [Nitrospirota bacterium]